MTDEKQRAPRSLEDIKLGENDPILPMPSGDNLRPPWLDQEKLDRGQEFFHRHIFPIVNSMYFSLLAGLSVNNLLEPLVFTGKSDTSCKSFRRYRDTLAHICVWLFGDIFDAPHGKAYRSLQIIYHIHHKVAAAMNKPDECISEREGKKHKTLHFSQYDMALTQAGFFGAVVIDPKKCGIRCTEGEIEDYVHFWRCVGYLLGIRDRYNIASGKTYANMYAICRDIERRVVLPALKDPPPDFEPMALAFIVGSNFFLAPAASLPQVMALAFQDDKSLAPPINLSFTDQMRVWAFKLVTGLCYYFRCFELMMNWLVHSACVRFMAHLKIADEKSD